MSVTEPDRNSLLADVLAPHEADLPDTTALVRRYEEQRAWDWLDALTPMLPSDVNEDELADFLWFALLGVAVGFDDRELSPFVEAHREIIPPLLADIRSVYEQIKARGLEYDRDLFRLRAFDYGIHKAYYLDWRLYMSKDLY